MGEKGVWEVSSHAVNDVTSRGQEGNMPCKFHFSFPGRSKDNEISYNPFSRTDFLVGRKVHAPSYLGGLYD